MGIGMLITGPLVIILVLVTMSRGIDIDLSRAQNKKRK